jgi:tagaturonate reductase
MVIIPTELISDNGRKLKEIVQHLAEFNRLETNFMDWLDGHNYFCSSLVDRIVPGRPEGPALENIQKYLGYEDDLLLVCESYHLWAIEGSRELLSGILSFVEADSGVIIAANIDTYKELKLRLLNGTHSLCCGLAFLAGFDTVRDAMEDEVFGDFIKELMMNEIAHAIPMTLPEGEARRFGEKVLDRFRNPYLEHRWINITLQYSLKMKARVLPVLQRHYALKGTAPACISRGFAGYLLFMRPIRKEGSKFVGESRGIHYTITDDMADALAGCWASGEPRLAVKQALQLESLWETDLTRLKGFEGAVYEALLEFMEKGGL